MTTDLNTLSAKELVRHYNALPNVTPITGLWKGSKAALLERIEKATPVVVAPVAATKTTKHNSFITEYCAKHGLNAKVVRARRRGAGYHAPYGENELRVAVSDLAAPEDHRRNRKH